jgi:hypothetical protein
MWFLYYQHLLLVFKQEELCWPYSYLRPATFVDIATRTTAAVQCLLENADE